MDFYNLSEEDLAELKEETRDGESSRRALGIALILIACIVIGAFFFLF